MITIGLGGREGKDVDFIEDNTILLNRKKNDRQIFYPICDENSHINEFMLVLTKRLISIAYREIVKEMTKGRVKGMAASLG